MKEEPKYSITYAATGLGFGLAIGIILDKTLIGFCSGIVLGTIVDLVTYNKKKKNS